MAHYSSCLEKEEEFSSLDPGGLKPNMYETEVTTPISPGSDEKFQFG
jgi:hypothetical protein